MAATLIGIVHSAASGIVRRVIVPDDDSELSHPSHVGKGEAMVTSPRFAFRMSGPGPNLADARQVVATSLKIDPATIPSGRCAIVVNGVVTDFVMADPAIDGVPGATLVLSDTANQGDTYDPVAGRFTPAAVPAPTA